MMGRRCGRALGLLVLILVMTAVPASAANKTWAKIGTKIYNGAGKRIPGALTRGIDISSWQDVIDWDELAAPGDVDFVFVRLMHGFSTLDPLFDYNVRSAIAHDIPVGVYVYSMARSYQEVLAEAQYCLQRIRGYKISYPVVFDIEDSSQERFSREKLTRMAELFCSEIQKAGYTPMLYCNQRWYTEFLNVDSLGVDVWLARFADSITGPDRSQFRYTIWQGSGGATGAGNRTTRGLIPGIDPANEVDIDIGFVDYTKLITPRTAPLASYVPTQKLSAPYIDEGWEENGGETSYYDNGEAVTGWKKINGVYYYFTDKGVMAKNTLIKKGQKLYYVGPDGRRTVNDFVTTGGKTYYFGSDGKAVKGFLTLGTKMYYFDPADFHQFIKVKFSLGGSVYYARKNGLLARKKWITLKEQGVKHTYYFGADGKAKVGLKKIGGVPYYFYETGTLQGVRAENTEVTTPSGKTYVATEDGVIFD